MQITYPVVQYWQKAKSPCDDRLLYEIVIDKRGTVADAKAELKRVLVWVRGDASTFFAR